MKELWKGRLNCRLSKGFRDFLTHSFKCQHVIVRSWQCEWCHCRHDNTVPFHSWGKYIQHSLQECKLLGDPAEAHWHIDAITTVLKHETEFCVCDVLSLTSQIEERSNWNWTLPCQVEELLQRMRGHVVCMPTVYKHIQANLKEQVCCFKGLQLAVAAQIYGFNWAQSLVVLEP